MFSAVLLSSPDDARAQDDAAALCWVPFEEVDQYDLTSSFREFYKKNRHKLERFTC